MLEELKELLNQQKYYELHDILEEYWNTLDIENPVKLKVQGLIQIIVAMHHKTNLNIKGYKILKAKGFQKLEINSHNEISDELIYGFILKIFK